jgi:hypothetical protein
MTRPAAPFTDLWETGADLRKHRDPVSAVTLSMPLIVVSATAQDGGTRRVWTRVQSRYPGQPLDDVIQRQQRVVPEARQVVVPAVQIGLGHQPLSPSRLWDRAGLPGPRRNRRLGLTVPSTTLTTRSVAETAGPTAYTGLPPMTPA